LSKREFLYKQFFFANNFKLNLPKYLLASPTNPILEDLKKSYTFNDPINFSSEFSREFFYQNLSQVQSKGVKDLITQILYTPSINFNFNLNYLLYYFISLPKKDSISLNLNFYKNQYKPMKKGVNNMVKLHATGAIAMPIEIRMHILASSKDVIHS